MTTRRAVFFALILAAQSGQSQTLQPRPEVAALSCTTSSMSCNTTVSGALTTDDCVFSDGSNYDIWAFSGTAGQLVSVTLRTTDPNYREPFVQLIAPSGDTSAIPFAGGKSPVTLRYKLSSSGMWRIAVEEDRAPFGGQYDLSLSCNADDSTGQPGCVSQTLSCGQAFSWALTSASCVFQGSGLPYAQFLISMTVGDTVRFVAHSDDFDPALAIYRGGGQAIAGNTGQRFFPDAAITFSANTTAVYQVVVYSAQSSPAGGKFQLSTGCVSVCGPPTFTAQPVDVRVPHGGSVTLTAAASSSTSAAATISWYEASNPLAPIGTGTSLTVTGLTRTGTYYARASTPCGAFTDSRIVTVTVDSAPRRRPTRH